MSDAGLALSAAAGAALAAYATLVEPRRLALTYVRRVDARVPRAVRVLLLADIHATPSSRLPFAHVARAAAWARAHGATAAAIAGDIVDDDRDARAVGERLRDALAPLRVLYTTGNHESADERSPRFPFRMNATRRSVDGLDAAGLERLDGRAVEVGGARLVGIGWPGWRPGAPADAVALVREGAAVVVTHSPDHARGLPPEGVVLALCGHTHGGQVRLPLVGAPWTPVRTRLPALAGAMALDGVPAYVSRGVGQTVPLRLGAVPEATLVEIAPDRTSRAPAGTRAVEL